MNFKKGLTQYGYCLFAARMLQKHIPSCYTIAATAGIHKFDRFMAFPESSPSSSSFDDGPEREQQAARLILQNASKTSFSTFNNEFTGLLLFVCARLTADAARLSLKKKKKKKRERRVQTEWANSIRRGPDESRELLHWRRATTKEIENKQRKNNSNLCYFSHFLSSLSGA